jgi:Na+/H+ antiporter NhaC
MKTATTDKTPLHFYGGYIGALLPFFIFLLGVVWIALSGAPDERGFWPIILLALSVGLFLSRDRKRFSTVVLEGMSQPIVMVMITAWMLASCIGVLMTETGFVEALTWLADQMQLNGTGFVVVAFIICAMVSLSTGSSFATILICGPVLYPAGGLLGAPLSVLAGAIIGGATFGDFFAPISDTTIASALSQKAEIGPTVRSRLRYVLPAAIMALIAYFLVAWFSSGSSAPAASTLEGSAKGLPMLLVPILILYLFLKGSHLMQGLLSGLVFGIALSLILGLLTPGQLLSIDPENFTARSFIIDGINRAVGISFFTILLMGMVETLKRSGMMDHLVERAAQNSQTVARTERWIAGSTGLSVLLTTHSIVAILTVAEFAEKTGERMHISAIRRSNIMSLVVCFFPFTLPYMIPVILMANTTSSGEPYGISPVSPLNAGLYNFMAWGLLLMLIMLLFGYGRKK